MIPTRPVGQSVVSVKATGAGPLFGPLSARPCRTYRTRQGLEPHPEASLRKRWGAHVLLKPDGAPSCLAAQPPGNSQQCSGELCGLQQIAFACLTVSRLLARLARKRFLSWLAASTFLAWLAPSRLPAWLSISSLFTWLTTSRYLAWLPTHILFNLPDDTQIVYLNANSRYLARLTTRRLFTWRTTSGFSA